MLATLPQVASAQSVTCQGVSPDWTLSASDTTATLTFDRTSQMQIMQDDLSQNEPNIRAMTLIGPRDSAIAIFDTKALRATILTQRGQSPIILSGTCD